MTKLTPSTTEEQSLAESTSSQRKFWGTIALGAVLLALSAYVFTILLEIEKTPIINLAVVVAASIFIASATGFVLAIRKQQLLGAETLFFAVNALGVIAVVTFQGRALPASFSLLIISVLVIVWLFPNNKKRFYSGILATSFILIWVVELLNPAWRIQFPAITAGPIAAVFFVLALLIIIVRQAWGNARTSLRHRITLTIIFATSISVLLVGGYFLYESYSNLSTQSVKSLEETSSKNAENIQRFLHGLEEDVHFLSSSVVLSNYVTSENDAQETSLADLEKEFFEFAQSRLIYDQIRFINVDGQEIVRINTSREGSSTIVSQENLQNKATRGYFISSIDLPDGALFISALDLNVEQGKVEEPHKPVIRYATPVFIEGTLHGIVITNVFAENFLAPLGEGSTENYLIDQDGYYLYNNDQSKRWGRDLETGFILAQDYSAFSQSLLSGDIEPFNDGVLFFASTAITLANESSPRWYLVSQTSEQSVFAPANRALLIGFAIMILTALVGVLITNTSFRSTISSVDHLTKTAQQITSGDLNAVANVESEDEMGILAETFNSMTLELQETLRGLEERVKERTQNLELAAEVGRSVSQVQDLDIMLRNACDLILNEFDLYYVQVYLADERQAILSLEAGTGDVGAQLLEREHSLPLSTASINGRAAIEKRSVVIPNTTESPTFRRNPLLPETRGEMAVPLIIENEVVGVLDMQSSQADVLSEEILPAFEALAGQLAVAIQNAYLLEETEQARTEVEAQARRQIRANWDEHLDAIHKPERIGYVFAKSEVSPLADIREDSLPNEAEAVVAPISLVGEELGSLVIEVGDDDQNTQTKELADAVGRQIAQQIENLRLLENAERYRREVEEATSRQTREGWEKYIASRGKEDFGYLYDTNMVQPYADKEDTPTSLTIPLKAREEKVGKLAIQDIAPEDEGSVRLSNAVAERLGAHIENLRLAEQTRQSLAETAEQTERLARLNTLSETLPQAETLEDIYKVTATLISEVITANRFSMTRPTEGGEMLEVFALQGEAGAIPTGTQLPIKGTAIGETFSKRRGVIVPDLSNSDYLESKPLSEQGLKSTLTVPLVVAGETFGTLNFASTKVEAYTNRDQDIAFQAASLIASSIENRQQYERAQKQADREAMLNVINQKTQGATSVEAVLQIAARELGHALDAPMTVAQLSIKDRE